MDYFHIKLHTHLSVSVKVEIYLCGEKLACSISQAGRQVKWDNASFSEWIYFNLHTKLVNIFLYHSYINSLIFKDFFTYFYWQNICFCHERCGALIVLPIIKLVSPRSRAQTTNAAVLKHALCLSVCPKVILNGLWWQWWQMAQNTYLTWLLPKPG